MTKPNEQGTSPDGHPVEDEFDFRPQYLRDYTGLNPMSISPPEQVQEDEAPLLVETHKPRVQETVMVLHPSDEENPIKFQFSHYLRE